MPKDPEGWNQTLGVRPAMEEQLTDHVWSIETVIELPDRRSAVAA
jgi:hypothetical protein